MRPKASLKQIVITAGIILAAAIALFLTIDSSSRDLYKKPASLVSKISKNMSYHINIVKEAQENENFRRVLFTGPKSQLVVMSIPSGGEVGEETHKYTEQTLFFLSGVGE